MTMLREPHGQISQKRRHFTKHFGCLSTGSVIIYVWRKKDAECISDQLRGYGDVGKVVCYHAGMSASDRASSQNMVSALYQRTTSFQMFPSDLSALFIQVHERESSHMCSDHSLWDGP
jgi:hypothetical protein